MQRRGFLACGAAVWLACSEALAFAQALPTRPPQAAPQPVTDVDDLNLIDLLDVTVSIAAGHIQRPEEAPSIVSVITDEDIRRLGAQTLQDVLRTVPGFEILTDNLGRSRIAVRGVATQLGTSENVLILFNGRRLNDHMYGGATVANLEIPVYNLKQIEVVRGPGSALYGTNAFTAVINLVGYTATTFDGVEVSAGSGSFGTQQYSVLAARTRGALGLSASFQFRDTDGAKLLVPADAQTLLDRALAPFGVRPASLAPRTTQDDRRGFDATFGTTFKGFTVDARVNDTASGGFIGRVDILGSRNRLTNRHVSIGASQRVAVSRRASVTASAAFMQAEVREDLNPIPPGYTRILPNAVFVFPEGILVDYTTNSRRIGGEVAVDYQATARNQVTVGGGFEREATFDLRTSGNFDIFTGAPLGRSLPLPFTILAPSARTIASAFVQDTWNIDPRLGITTGLRYDRYSDFGDTVNPRAALVWRLPASLHVKALYGRAFRAPTFSELFAAIPDAIVGNPSLRPPTINTLELGLGYRARNLRVTGNYFANFIHDFIISTRPVSVEGIISSLTFVNTAGLNVQGAEFEIRRTLGINDAIFVNYTYQHDTPHDRGTPMPDLPAQVLNAGATVGIGRYVSLSPTVLARGSRPRVIQDPRPPVPPYGVLNLNARIKNLFETFEISATVDNVFDRQYVDPSPFLTLPGDYPKPGRSIFVKANYKF
jgi:outer membrane receptor protein involved in Fe transport